ncbi:MAG: DUF952 domain-containing protein [Acidimicrobiales bacterium]
MADPIFHITTVGEWRDALEAGRYTAPSLADEGFIHASTAEQVAGTAQRYYREVPDLVLLVIDRDAVAAEIRWEESRPGEPYPHIYGELEPSAVVRVVPFGPEPDGSYVVPAEALGGD